MIDYYLKLWSKEECSKEYDKLLKPIHSKLVLSDGRIKIRNAMYVFTIPKFFDMTNISNIISSGLKSDNPDYGHHTMCITKTTNNTNSKISKTKPDLIIMYGMKQNDLELNLSKTLKTSHTSNVPIIILTHDDDLFRRLEKKSKSFGFQTIEKLTAPRDMYDMIGFTSNTSKSLRYIISSATVEDLDSVSTTTKFINSISNVCQYSTDNKVLIVVDSSGLAKRILTSLSKRKKYATVDDCNLIGLDIYHDFTKFADLNNGFAEKCILQKKESGKESGIIVLTTDKLLEIIDNRDTVFSLSKINVLCLYGKNGFYDLDTKRIVNTIRYINRDIPLCISDLDREDLAAQIVRAHSNLHVKKSDNLELYSNLKSAIKNETITFEQDTELTEEDTKYFESRYKIRKRDLEYANRHDIIYMETISSSRKQPLKMSGRHMYELELPYLKPKNRSQINIDILCEEVNKITNDPNPRTRLKKYSGPVWLGKRNGKEYPGSKIGFAHEKKDIVEICEILGVYDFTRTYKRKGWTEKENRDRKILFLSPIIRTMKLSSVKRIAEKANYERFSRMQKVCF